MTELITPAVIRDAWPKLIELYGAAIAIIERQMALVIRARNGEDVSDEWQSIVDRLREVEAEIRQARGPLKIIDAGPPAGGAN